MSLFLMHLRNRLRAHDGLSLKKLVAVIRLYITLGYKTDLGIQKYLDTVSPPHSNGIFWSSTEPPLGIKKNLRVSTGYKNTSFRILSASVEKLSQVNKNRKSTE